MTTKPLTVLLCVALCACFFLAGGTVSAQKTKGKELATATRYLMRGISGPNCGGLAASLKDAGPADDEAWDTAACQASCLNELSYILMDDGRCPDGDWAGAAKQLRAGSTEVLSAIEKKDLEGARTAFKNVIGACAACHKVHKS